MNSSVKASTSYKKKNGILALSKDGKNIAWTPDLPADAAPYLTIAIIDIVSKFVNFRLIYFLGLDHFTDLQQTPANSAKVSTKVVVQRPGAPATDNYVFSFISASSAKAEQSAITDALRTAIEKSKAQNLGQAVQGTESDGNAVDNAPAKSQGFSRDTTADNWLYDSRLKADVELQRSLLHSNPNLRKIFEQALLEKPESISISQFSGQFWSTRLHMLRSHAVEKIQTQGAYNVLAEVKPKNIDGTTRLNLSKEQIQLIFDQHPLVKRVYNENVPKLTEMEFWARFFVSRLFKKLKGEKITGVDSTDPILDKYLGQSEENDRTRPGQELHIPNFIDLEGNEQNHSQKQGNLPDLTMRPNSYEKVPILKVLNSMSEKMIFHVNPMNSHPHAPVGMDEETFNEVRLRDLQTENSDNRVRLNIKHENVFYLGDNSGASQESFRPPTRESYESALQALRTDFESNAEAGGLDLRDVGEVDEESDSDEEISSTTLNVGSQTSLRAAMAEILKSIKDNRQINDETFANNFAAKASAMGIPQIVSDSLSITHSTTIEFLHYFWAVFLSGDPERAGELAKLVETLDKSLDRISAVAQEADKAKQAQLDKMKKQWEEYQQRTRKKKAFDPSGMKGGAKVVNQLMAPTVQAINVATTAYRKAFEEQSLQA